MRGALSFSRRAACAAVRSLFPHAAGGAARAEKLRKIQREGESEDDLEDAAQYAQEAQQARARVEAQPQPPRGGGGCGDRKRAGHRRIDRVPVLHGRCCVPELRLTARPAPSIRQNSASTSAASSNMTSFIKSVRKL